MKSRFFAFILGLTMMTAALAHAGVSVDYDHSANFSGYKTYSWLKIKAPNGIWYNRIAAAIEAGLNAKGWTKVDQGGDVGLVALGTTKEEHSLSTFYNGFGPGLGLGWGGWGPREATTRVDTFEEGTLLVDMYDGKTKQLIWTANATDSVSNKPEKNEKTLAKEVDKMFKNFPPGSEKKKH